MKKSILKFILLLIPVGFAGLVIGLIIDSFKIAEGNIGLIEIKGPVYFADEYLADIRFFEKKDSVKGVLLRLETPGGAVGAVQEIYSGILRLSEKKPVVASMGNVSASGGYYIACAANKIIANPGTITGSIGVIFEYMNLEGVLRAIKMEPVVFKSGKFKDSASPFRKPDREETAYLQGLIDELYSQFRNTVKERRGLSSEVMDNVANGKVFTGETALKLGLIDAIGDMGYALEELKKLAQVKEERIIRPPRRKVSLVRKLLELIDHGSLLGKKWEGGFSYMMVLP